MMKLFAYSLALLSAAAEFASASSSTAPEDPAIRAHVSEVNALSANQASPVEDLSNLMNQMGVLSANQAILMEDRTNLMAQVEILLEDRTNLMDKVDTLSARVASLELNAKITAPHAKQQQVRRRLQEEQQEEEREDSLEDIEQMLQVIESAEVPEGVPLLINTAILALLSNIIYIGKKVQTLFPLVKCLSYDPFPTTGDVCYVGRDVDHVKINANKDVTVDAGMNVNIDAGTDIRITAANADVSGDARIGISNSVGNAGLEVNGDADETKMRARLFSQKGNVRVDAKRSVRVTADRDNDGTGNVYIVAGGNNSSTVGIGDGLKMGNNRVTLFSEGGRVTLDATASGGGRGIRFVDLCSGTEETLDMCDIATI